ncbi:MAG: bestrophin [Sandaracinaceae bacterium]|nr:bestrophin [Sandaracinaceae bacterium]
MRLTTTVKGTVVKRVAPRVAVYAGLAAVAAVLVLELGVHAYIGSLAHSLLGIALGMLLVFRTNAAYDRYWEGRRRWSAIVAASRNLVRGAIGHARDPGPIAQLVTAYVTALRHRLQGDQETRDVQRRLGDEDARALGPMTADPLALTARITARIQEHVESGALRPEIASSLERYVGQLVEHQSACERIATSPVPIAYAAQIRHLLVVYLATLPFALVAELGWLTVPAMAVIAFGLIGIEEAGMEIEDPFGHDENDLPLQAFCDGLAADAKVLTESGRGPARARSRTTSSLIPLSRAGELGAVELDVLVEL